MPAKDYNNYMNEYLTKRYHIRREKLVKILGEKCFKCGSKNNLQFDHTNHKEKRFNMAKIITSYSWKRVLKEFEKCQLLCEDCHKQKTKDEGSNSLDRLGEKNWNSKLTEVKVKEIKQKLKENRSLRSLGKEYGVSHVVILSIKKGKTWKHVGQ